MSSNNFLWVLILLTLNLAVGVTSDTLLIENLTSAGGSQYEYYMDSDSYNSSSGFTIQEGENFEILVGIKVLSFASNVNDFHDVFLYIRLNNNEGLLIDTVVRLDIISTANMKMDFFFQFDSTEFQYINSNSSVMYYTNFNIYVGSTFREDVSLNTDPSTDDRWHFLREVDVLSPVTEDLDVISTAPEKFLNNEINNTTYEDPTITTSPEPYILPPVVLAIPLLILLVAGILFFQRRSKSEIVASGSIRSKKMILPETDHARSRISSISALLCPNCGTLNTDSSQFCIECGIHLSNKT